jgi:hypothetical protein
MIIFQTAGCGCANGLKINAGILDRGSAPATTFRSNDYIHRLNRTLQAEMRALSAYTSLLSNPQDHADLVLTAENHQLASRELIRLIIANRGIPEDRAGISLGLTRSLIRLCTLVPTRLTDKVSLSTLRRIEQGLVVRYEKLLKMAPTRDQEALLHLLAQTQQQNSALTTQR